VDSDPEDDPGRMLNVWLGQLQKDMASPTENNGENGFHKVAHPKNGGGTVSSTAPIVKRRQQHDQNNTDAIKTNLKNQYRCSLINLEETQDDELDAILGELSILESQFQEEIAENSVNAHSVVSSTQVGPAKGPTTTTKQSSPVASVTSSTSRSSPTSSSDTAAASKKQSNSVNGKRTESPDTDSAFCDNLSVLSSCSTSSRSNGIQSSSGISSATSTPEEQEAKLKAEKIKLAIEKIKEANIKKIFIKVFTSDGSAKSLLVDEKMSVSHVTRILAEKNHVKLDPRWTLVELIPDLYMERVYEDHENLVENCLMWTVDSKNTLWFIERPEKYDVFVRPERYLLGTSSSQQGDTMEDHARQELLEEYFSSTGVGAPEMEGHVWLKTDNKKSWKKFFFVLRTSGLYYAPKGKKSSKDLVCLATFDVNQVYYGAGWKKKYKAPTDFCFAIKVSFYFVSDESSSNRIRIEFESSPN
jgi:amyloid beta A4 precursor protein-binding family B protein 1-interacting protein